MCEKPDERDWDLARGFITYLGFLIGTCMVFGGTVLVKVPDLYKLNSATNKFEPMNETLARFYCELLSRLSLTIGVAAAAALVLFYFRTVFPPMTREAWKNTNSWPNLLTFYGLVAAVPTVFGARAVLVVYDGFMG